MCKALFTDPNTFVEKLKEEIILEKSVGIMALSGVIVALASAVAMDLLDAMPITLTGSGIVTNILALSAIELAVASFFMVFIGGLFFGWITKLVMVVLGGEGGYFEGLTAVAYPSLVVSLGALVAVLLSYVPAVGTALAFIVITVFFAVGYASIYRLTKDLFEVNMITAFVGVSVIFAIAFVGIYGSLATTAQGLKMILPGA